HVRPVFRTSSESIISRHPCEMFADSYINYAFSTIFVPFALFLLLFRYFFVQSVHPLVRFLQHQLHFIYPFCQNHTFFLFIPFFISPFCQNRDFFCIFTSVFCLIYLAKPMFMQKRPCQGTNFSSRGAFPHPNREES